jgi:Domain of unknown function (DUF4276)
MPAIVPIVEGDGDAQAAPSLITRFLHEREKWDWTVAHPKKAGGLVSLQPKLAQFLRYAEQEPQCGAVLILLDLDDGCPREEAFSLANTIRSLTPSHPVGVVFAHREYEAWFLASLDTIAGTHNIPEGLTYQGEVEARRGAKEWLTKQMPRGTIYKETIHQSSMTRQIDLDLARKNSRSFRRLDKAIGELIDAAEQNRALVTPLVT